MSFLGPDRRIVGRSVVNRSEAVCLTCRQPFKFGVNVFTDAGHREVAISGMCEKCFDECTLDLEEDV